MKTGTAAKEVSVTPATLRRWEKIGLIPIVPRDEKGQRVFTPEIIQACQAARLMLHPRYAQEDICASAEVPNKVRGEYEQPVDF